MCLNFASLSQHLQPAPNPGSQQQSQSLTRHLQPCTAQTLNSTNSLLQGLLVCNEQIQTKKPQVFSDEEGKKTLQSVLEHRRDAESSATSAGVCAYYDSTAQAGKPAVVANPSHRHGALFFGGNPPSLAAAGSYHLSQHSCSAARHGRVHVRHSPATARTKPTREQRENMGEWL